MSAATSGHFRILSIDGGGFRGLYAAHVLARTEQVFGTKWTDAFDLIAGTSTGAIVAAALACGKKAQEVEQLYLDHGKHIFRKRWLHPLGLLGSRYRNRHLKAALLQLFGGMTLGDISTPLILPATDIGDGRVHVLKSSYHGDFVRDKNMLVRDAVVASCSAPTYFDPCRVGPYLLADGGLWANSPSLVAAIDAKRRLGAELAELRILSVGTGVGHKYYPQRRRWWHMFTGWGFAGRWGGGKFVNMVLNLQSQTANNMLGLLLSPDQVLRINFESDTDLPLDSPATAADLVCKADLDFTYNSVAIRRLATRPVANGSTSPHGDRACSHDEGGAK